MYDDAYLLKHHTGQKCCYFCWLKVTEHVPEQQLCQQDLLGVDLACHTALQLHYILAVQETEGLQNLRINKR